MPMERIKPDAFPSADRIEALKELFPEAFADGAINWATLRDLAATLPAEDEEENSEHFGLFWPGKREARRLAGKAAEGTLIPCPGEGVDEDKTSNIFIEGENLEVLKLLRKSYKGMVKMIYIDPPYNTGNDFVYDDNFTEPLEDYLRRTGQIDGEGRPLTTNKKSEGRFHSKWLSMMYPRLRLARELLRDDGVIFVSIDDNEVQHLRMLMNEVFGEENFVAELIWQSKKGGGSDSTGIVLDIEYILVFVNKSGTGISKKEIASEDLGLSDEKGPYRLGRELNKWGANSRRQDRPTMYFPIKGPGSIDVYPTRNDGSEGRWRWGKKKMEDIVQRNDIKFEKRIDGTYIAYEKIRSIDPRYKPYRSLLSIKATTAYGTKRIKELFGKKYFDYAKPIELVTHLMEIALSDNDDSIIMDFFAGSGSTFDAALVSLVNQEEYKKVKFIGVQLPEKFEEDDEAYRDGYKTISDIAVERIRRVIKKIKAEKARELSAEDETPDLGFKVFKLARSNFKPWKDYHGDDIAAIESLFENAVTPLAEEWKNHPDALFTEILLLEGYPLDSAVRARAEFVANRIREVSCPQHEKRLLVCLDDAIAPETVSALELSPDEIFVCLDSAIDDSTKARLDDKGMIKTI